jgi:Na+/proline symporter
MSNALSPTTTLAVIIGYFLFLIVISMITSRGANNQTFFTANKKSPWYLVAFGMIGTSLSGVTFISIPGVVGAGGYNMNLSYMQMVFGYLLGYLVIATVLMPLYYKLNLTTIYGYLRQRFGVVSYKTGAFYFLVSRIVGASFRLFLVAIVLQNFVMESLGVSFYTTVAITIILIWIYTYRGGIKTIVWTDTIQTSCMLGAVIMTIWAIGGSLDLSLGQMWGEIADQGYTQMFYFGDGWSDPNNFYKQFVSGALIAIVMTGLDQDMMQKNLTCKTLGDAQKNMFTFSFILIFANLLFLVLGGLLYVYSMKSGIAIPDRTDLMYPEIALNHLGSGIGIIFILGLIAAAYSSADSALTALTTSFCIDFLDFERTDRTEEEKQNLRLKVHVAFSIMLFMVIASFKLLNNDAIINQLFRAAGYTYGPLLGLFTFGMFTKINIRDRWVWLVCLVAPLLTVLIDLNSEALLGGFKFGSMLIALNGLLTFIGLWLLSLNHRMSPVT